MHFAVEGVPHVEDDLLPELLEEVAPYGRHAPAGGGDYDEHDGDPDEQNLPVHRDGPRLLAKHVIQDQGQRPWLGEAGSRLQEQEDEGEKQTPLAWLEERYEVGERRLGAPEALTHLGKLLLKHGVLKHEIRIPHREGVECVRNLREAGG